MSPRDPQSGTVLPFGQPKDYAGQARFADDNRRPFQFIPSRPRPLTFGEKLVDFMRRWQFRAGIVCLAIAVLAGCYFAIQIGRGL